MDTGRINFRDLRRGCLIGLTAGVGYVLAYRIILLFAWGSRFYDNLLSLGWLLAIPAPLFLFWWMPRQIKPDDAVQPEEPVRKLESNGDDADSA